MVTPDSQAQRACCQAETPLVALCRFPEPALMIGMVLKNTREQQTATNAPEPSSAGESSRPAALE